MANVSHELRTPLNMITGFSAMILQAPAMYGSVPPGLLADLAVIQRNAAHLSELIDDMLDLGESMPGDWCSTASSWPPNRSSRAQRMRCALSSRRRVCGSTCSWSRGCRRCSATRRRGPRGAAEPDQQCLALHRSRRCDGPRGPHNACLRISIATPEPASRPKAPPGWSSLSSNSTVRSGAAMEAPALAWRSASVWWSCMAAASGSRARKRPEPPSFSGAAGSADRGCPVLSARPAARLGVPGTYTPFGSAQDQAARPTGAGRDGRHSTADIGPPLGRGRPGNGAQPGRGGGRAAPGACPGTGHQRDINQRRAGATTDNGVAAGHARGAMLAAWAGCGWRKDRAHAPARQAGVT